MTPRPFPRAVLAGPSLDAAVALLGALLVRDDRPGGRRVGRIVEVEAYIGHDDRASHARAGPTARTAVMFGPPGLAYVYLVYGMYHCLNVVTEPEGLPAAILIRAVEPVEGAVRMREARAARAEGRGRTLGPIPDSRLASGPGLVGEAFELAVTDSGIDLCDRLSRIRLEEAPAEARHPRIVATPRVGIASAGEPWTSHPWRLLDATSPSVSGRPGADRRPAR